MVLSAGTAWLASRSGGEGTQAIPDDRSVVLTPVVGFTAPNYAAAIAELERVIDERRDQLDTATVRIIEDNLVIINQAIAQAARALVDDPASAYLNEHLAATMRQKLEFLRRAAELTSAVS
jgi:hypothetical protein